MTAAGWWNARNIPEHFDVLRFVLENGIFSQTFEGLLAEFDITEDDLYAEIEWVAGLVADYFNDQEVTVLSHNDPHFGNIMIDEGDYTGESLILIDYDNTRYGYRPFDPVYFFNYLSISAEAASGRISRFYVHSICNNRR